MKTKKQHSINEKSILDKKAELLVKKDKAAKMLLKNPPKFSPENYKKIRKWILSLVDLIY